MGTGFQALRYGASWGRKRLVDAVLQQPVSVSMTYTRFFQHYFGGIVPDSECGYFWEVNHDVLLVGYGNENGKDYWLVKNSHGARWGEHGYMRLERGNSGRIGTCQILFNASYPNIKLKDKK